MDLSDATRKLNEISKGLEYIPFISYVAIVKHENDPNEYLLECGLHDPDGAYFAELKDILPLEALEQVQNNSPELYNYIKKGPENFNKYKFIHNSNVILLNDNSNGEIKETSIMSGSSIGNEDLGNIAGTLGAFFYLNGDKNLYALSNAHTVADTDTEENAKIITPFKKG